MQQKIEMPYYTQAIDLKKHAEDRRDDINKYYISLFAIIVSVMPFINQAQKVIDLPFFAERNINLLIVMLSTIGLSLSWSWIKVLHEVRGQLAAIESFLKTAEEKQDNGLFTYMSTFLHKEKSASKITRYELLVPYSFMLIFAIVLCLSLLNGKLI